MLVFLSIITLTKIMKKHEKNVIIAVFWDPEKTRFWLILLGLSYGWNANLRWVPSVGKSTKNRLFLIFFDIFLSYKIFNIKQWVIIYIVIKKVFYYYIFYIILIVKKVKKTRFFGPPGNPPKNEFFDVFVMPSPFSYV